MQAGRTLPAGRERDALPELHRFRKHSEQRRGLATRRSLYLLLLDNARERGHTQSDDDSSAARAVELRARRLRRSLLVLGLVILSVIVILPR